MLAHLGHFLPFWGLEEPIDILITHLLSQGSVKNYIVVLIYYQIIPFFAVLQALTK